MRRSAGRTLLVSAVTGVAALASTVCAASFEMPMRSVPGGGEPNGPAYDFWMGRYEVTVAQYIAFLNDAEANADNERGAYMIFDPNNGDVGLPGGLYPDDLFDISDNDSIWTYAPHYTITYDPNSAAGSRYTYDPNDGNYPIVGMSWIGALKFCNWLTLDHGLDPNQRCYAEGDSYVDWHPVTISTADWAVRDLTASERQTLVDGYVGYRLPMDNIPLPLNGYIDGQPNPYNEWYKAAAYDSNAPDYQRTWNNAGLVPSYKIPPYHWRYGYGSDQLDLTKANFLIYDANVPGGVDPNCVRFPTPVGTYAATNGNPWGIDDLSGNVFEWGQDYCYTLDPVRLALHGKAYDGGEPAAALRHYRVVYNGTYFVGLRVLQCGGYHLSATVNYPDRGEIDSEPNQAAYPPGAQVTLTATPVEGKSFKWWRVYDPADANNVVTDANNPLVLTMNADRQVEAVFNCGSGLEPMLPLVLGAMGFGLISARRRRQRL